MARWESTSTVPFLHEKRIEEEADLLIAEYGRDRKPVTVPPVPVEQIMEAQLELTVEFDDLRAMFESDDVLGAIWFKDALVKVDQNLDPHVRPALLGRFRFTLAHETAHWCLHRKYYQADPSQAHLFDGRGAPAFVCRSSEKPPVEWQADTFAGYLLMPKKLVVAAWQEWRGGLDPVVLASLPPAPTRSQRDPDNARMEHFCKPLAEKFEVSAEAMRIRLEKLGLLLREVPNTLF
jgi:hypothetical protein